MNILVVDDDVHIRRIVSHYLGDATVREAASGEEALAIAARERFDVAIVDLILPQFGGTRLCRKLRDTVRRIVVMSGDESARDSVSDCADAFLAKPFTREELRSAVAAA